MCAEMRIATGVGPGRLVKTALLAEEIVGHSLFRFGKVGGTPQRLKAQIDAAKAA